MNSVSLRSALLWLGAVSLVGCQSEPAESIHQTPVIQGMATPFRLDPDSTWVHLADHCPFEEPSAVVWLSDWAQGDTLEISREEDGLGVWIPEQPTRGFGGLAITVDGQTETVPVLSSTLRRVNYVLPSSLASAENVCIMGGFNGWSRSSHPLVKNKDGSWSIDLHLNQGKQAYQLIVDGQEMADPANPEQVDNGFGGYNSLLDVPGSAARVELAAIGFGGNQVHDIRLLGTPGSRVWAWWKNHLYSSTVLGANGTGLVRIPAGAYGAGRTNIRLWATGDGQPSHEVRLPLQDGLPLMDSKGLQRDDWESQVMYFMMVDRFRNGDPSNDRPVNDPSVHPKANDHGGDLSGIQSALDEGYFDDLGVTALWVSPLTRNPDQAFGLWEDPSTDLSSRFSGYHGYWPISNTEVDPRFGSREELDNLISSVHENHMNFLLDYVANHVHEDHPLYAEHPDWATDLYLPDGRENTQLWDDERLTTWFDTFMPTLDLRRTDVASAMSDSAAWWVTHSDIDGFRHDATKHIPLSFWRMLTRKVKAATAAGDRRIFQIGETYGSAELISSYLGTGLLDAQFDFNLYDRAVAAFGRDDAGLDDLVRVANEGLDVYGAHHLMGTITGNQDRPRFASLAEGTVRWDEDHKLAGWTRQIERQGLRGHHAMRMLTAFNLSMPGVPCIYQGDEYADVGGNDPDNRRPVRFENLTGDEQATRDHVRTWIELRKSRLSLTFGQTHIQALPSGLLQIQRQYLEENTVVLINPTSRPMALPDVDSRHILAGSTEGQLLPPYGCVAMNGGL